MSYEVLKDSYPSCEKAHDAGLHRYQDHIQNQIDRLMEAVRKADLTIVPDDSPDVFDLDCQVPLRLDPDSLLRALDDPEQFGWRGLPEYAIAYAAAIRDVKEHLRPRSDDHGKDG